MKKNNKTKFNQEIARVITFFIVFSLCNTNDIKSSATTLTLTEQTKMLGASSQDWKSTNLREWLNSNKDVVEYTAKAPSYKAEAGFLSSKNFTQTEYDSIAITKDSQSRQPYLRNYANTPYMSQKSVVHNDYTSIDKVFILNYSDIYNYIERNDLLLDYNTKYYSNHLQSQTNQKNKYGYLVNSGFYDFPWLGNDMYTSNFGTTHGRLVQNIVPALHLKPDYTFSNGVKAKDLQLNSTVTFGTYNGEPIEWQVINKTSTGYPLLWSTKILTTKEYDASGDINPPTSKYINYNSYDVDIYSNSQAHSFLTGNAIDTSPVITILNKTEAETPTNADSILIKIQVTDANHTISKLILPDGTTINGGYGEWLCKSNGEYDIKAINSEGILTVRHVVIGNINKPANVLITTDKATDTKWSNKPVTVNISTSNSNSNVRTISGRNGVNSANSSSFPSGYPYAGKKFRITGTLYNALTESEQAKVNMNQNINIQFNINYTDWQAIRPSWPNYKRISLKQLKDSGTAGVAIDEIVTMPSNYYFSGFNFSVVVGGGRDYTNTTEHPYKFNMSAVTVELVDADPLAISEIDMPDGSVIKAQNASYVIANAGSYKFTVKDNLGKTTSKTIDLDVDTVAPTINISNLPTSFVKQQTISIKATDNTSGVKSVKLPNGEYRENSTEGQSLNTTYNIVNNGTYVFEATDFAGNSTKKSVTINNIDNTPPVLNLTQNLTAYTNGNVTITATGSDTQSGVKRIKLPDGNFTNGSTATYSATANGIYTFVVEDNVGNTTTKSITISNIDKTAPRLSLSPSTATWTNSPIVITATGSDDSSGVKKIKLPDGTFVTGSTASYSTIVNGNYDFIIYDKAGNTTIKSIYIDNIKNTGSNLSISKDNDNWSNQNITITATFSDNLNTIKTIETPDGVKTRIHNKSPKILVIEWSNSTTPLSNTLKNLGYDVTLDNTVTTLSQLQGYDIIVADQYAWAVTKGTLLNQAYAQGYRILTQGNDTTNNIYPITSTVNNTKTFEQKRTVINEVTESIDVTNVGDRDTAKVITSIAEDTVAWSTCVNYPNSSGIIYSHNKNNGKWIHVQPIMINTAYNEFYMSAIDELMTGSKFSTTQFTKDYVANSNGTYTFKITDFAGNVTTKNITISNIDKTNPNLELSQSPTAYTSGNVVITANATDSESGVYQIQTPDGKWTTGSTINYIATSNGTYQFSVRDVVGNTTTKSININNIDRVSPSLTLTQSSLWTNGDVTITANAIDNASGVKQIILPDGSVVLGNKATFTVGNVGVYYFRAIDNVGNIGINYIVISNIDKNKPTVAITNNKNWSNASSENVVITATDK